MNDSLLVPRSPAVATAVPVVAIPNRRMHAFVLCDDEDVLEHIRRMLVRQECAVSAFLNVSESLTAVRQCLRPDVALIDPALRASDGGLAFTSFRQISPSVPVIAVSCSQDPGRIVEAIRMGATDVLVHPLGFAELKTCLSHCLQPGASPQPPQVQEIPLSSNTSFVFCSERMRSIASQCELVARTDLPVLILGASGTGKEVLAHYIHKMSACASFPFLKVNCAAMPTDLLESELFGYEQGAFTGALKAKPGKFELCDRGTIFLDEIGEMLPALQAKLLQVLQDGTFSRLGGRSTIKVDVRVIAATNIDIKAAIRERHFREDLYYRISGFSFQLPALRQRREEIPVLIRYFIRRASEKLGRQPASMSPDLLSACMEYDWPGNLRELENFVKRYLVVGDDMAMMAELSHIPAQHNVQELPPDFNAPAGGLKKMLSGVKGEAEARVIRAVLQRNQWRRKKTAAELQISYKALLYKMRQHDIVAPSSETACS